MFTSRGEVRPARGGNLRRQGLGSDRELRKIPRNTFAHSRASFAVLQCCVNNGRSVAVTCTRSRFPSRAKVQRKRSVHQNVRRSFSDKAHAL
jgi:hypothetical protein